MYETEYGIIDNMRLHGRFLARAFACAVVLAVFAPLSPARAEATIDGNGRRWVCEDGICRIVEDAPSSRLSRLPARASRMIVGSRGVSDFRAFLAGGGDQADDTGSFGTLTGLTLFLVVFGGLMLNLTPCVLPMVPVNLIIIGKSVRRGVAYGVGMALAYGALGGFAAVGGLAFGTIQSSPWFNLFVAFIFLALALSLFGLFGIDFARFRPAFASSSVARGSLVVAFLFGALSAVLAGACVAPVLVSVLVLTARLYAEGRTFALALPFALGLGMALPWPFLAAGMKVLPRPGAWMTAVNRVFALVLLSFAVWFGRLAYLGWAHADSSPVVSDSGVQEATAETFADALDRARKTGRPVFVDCWATWCKNCTSMERTTLAHPLVRDELKRFAVIRLKVDDVGAFRALAPFREVQGLPAYAVFENNKTEQEGQK